MDFIIQNTEVTLENDIRPCYKGDPRDSSESVSIDTIAKWDLSCIFIEIDGNGDGKLYPEELKSYLDSLGKTGEIPCVDEYFCDETNEDEIVQFIDK